MSEYQYYEFQAIDRPLTEGERVELRNYSTQATITPTRFVNSYAWGNFKGDPSAWMEKYFDAFVYTANWGTRELMLRLPRRALDLKAAKRYFFGKSTSLRETGDFAILALYSDDEEHEDWEDDGSGWLSSLIPLRADLASGDHRALYLAWLHCVQREQVADDALEPPVPAGLGTLTASLKALSDFLRLDRDLIEAAAAGSPKLEDPAPRDLEQWVATLPETEKTALLVRLTTGEEPKLQAELLRRFRAARSGEKGAPAARPRTVAELLAAAERLSEERRRRDAERMAQERARREREAAAAREKHLDGLARREPEAWRQVDALIATKRPGDYDQAVKLLADLRDLGARKGQAPEVQAQIARLREAHSKKPSFIQRLKEAGLMEAAP